MACRKVLLLIWPVLSIWLQASDSGIIRIGEIWRYLPGTSEPPAAWRTEAFDDSTWLAAPGGFSTPISFPERSPISGYGFGFTSIYFRKTFQLSETNEFAQWIL